MNQTSVEIKKPRSLLASVGPEPCLQCSESMQKFCATKSPRCPAMEHYVKTGETPERSDIGWVA